MAGTARKSTGSKKKSTKLVRNKISKKPKPVEVDPNKEYAVEKIGPVFLSWGKRRKKNKKGKIVKEWYLKDTKKHKVWVKWVEVFRDNLALEDENFTSCNWSAEPQSELPSSSVKSVLKEKVIWPWPGKEDENFEDRVALLKSEGYKEWKSKAKGKWLIQNAPVTETGSDSGSTSEHSDAGTDKDTTTSGTDGQEEEDDEV